MSPLIQDLLRLMPLHWLVAPPRLAPDLLAELAPEGIQGQGPVPWWAAGLYQGAGQGQAAGGDDCKQSASHDRFLSFNR